MDYGLGSRVKAESVGCGARSRVHGSGLRVRE